MPIVHREGPFVSRIWPADHDPPHVHVYNGDGMCVIEIETGDVRRDPGMRARDIYAAIRIIFRHQEKLMAEWRRFHVV